MITTDKIIDDALLAQIHAAGCSVWIADGVIRSTDDVAVQAIVDAYDPLPTAQAQAWSAIQKMRDGLKGSPILVEGKRFHSDADSRIQQLGLVLMGAGIPPGLQWKCVDGTFAMMTQALAQQIFAATALRDQAIFGAAEVHRLAMLQLEDPASYDFGGGWPEV